MGHLVYFIYTLNIFFFIHIDERNVIDSFLDVFTYSFIFMFRFSSCFIIYSILSALKIILDPPIQCGYILRYLENIPINPND